MERFEAYFQRADTDRDGRISGNEAVAFFQAFNLPKQVLAQIWTYADQNRTGFLGRPEFYNALKLVTVAQAKRDLTPDIVKAALYSPASAKIPAPEINLAASPSPQSNLVAGATPAQFSGSATSSQVIGVSGPHVFPSQQSQYTRIPRPPIPSSGFQSQLGVSSQGLPAAGSTSVPHRPSSSDSFGGSIDGYQAGISSQVSNRSLSTSAAVGGFSPTASPAAQLKVSEMTGLVQPAPSKANDTVSLGSQVGKEDSKSLSATGNGFASDPVFGDVFSVTPSQQGQNSLLSSAMSLSSSREQPMPKLTSISQPPAIQGQPFQSTGKANQHILAQSSSAFPVAAGNNTSVHSQSPWPKMMQSDIQKYSKVFVQVDTDRDGKITGEQARNLFLSWRLPREVLKQVWDLSDQDNDSMLSLKEFCVALYLMERYREGRPLPTVLPNSVIFDEALLPPSSQPAAAYGNTSWRPTPGLQQPQGARSARPMTAVGGGKPPRPVPVPQPDEPIQQKPKVPSLEKHLLDQLSTEEQDSLNKKFQEAKDAEKKVADLEKDILESKQKIQFYHAKMQELILYKSRCDNRLNEITEKVVADKREAESLAKKYEEKYKQVGDVASKLTIQEATFRDIQEKKMELYRAIVKLEQDNADDVKDRANQIQLDLEELVKALNERCKTYGLRGKPTSLVELPFGWQPGIGAAAADWDEVWDKFEDEGFAYVKELTLEVQNVTAPPKPKSSLTRETFVPLDNSSSVKSPSKADNNSELSSSGERVPENERPITHSLEQTARSPPDSPAGNNAFDSPSKKFQELKITKGTDINGSPHAFDTRSEYGRAESVISGDKGFDEPGWGSFDTHYDTDAAWDFNAVTPKDAGHERRSENSLFGSDDWVLNPIRTGSTGMDTTPKQGPFFDSVPSTPLYNSASSPNADNMFTRKSLFADSVPSTPMYNFNTSPKGFNEGSEERYSFDSFSRFDSFDMNDSGPFGSRESLTRFDSMRSTRDSDFDQGYFAPQEASLARFDSFRSTAESDYNFGSFAPRDSFSRFDSMGTPRDSFSRFDSMGTPRDSFSRFDSMRSTRDSDYGHGFPSFDDAADPFGTSEPFRTSLEAQTPRKDSDSWKAF